MQLRGLQDVPRVENTLLSFVPFRCSLCRDFRHQAMQHLLWETVQSEKEPLHIHIASSYCNMPARMERQGPQPARSTKPALAHSWTEGVWHHKQKVVLFLSACQELLVRGSSEKPRGPESTSEGLILPSASLPLPSTSQPSFGCAYFQHAPAFCNPLVMPASSASVGVSQSTSLLGSTATKPADRVPLKTCMKWCSWEKTSAGFAFLANVIYRSGNKCSHKFSTNDCQDEVYGHTYSSVHKLCRTRTRRRPHSIALASLETCSMGAPRVVRGISGQRPKSASVSRREDIACEVPCV